MTAHQNIESQIAASGIVTNSKMDVVQANYSASVLTAAGWRNVTITAKIKKTTNKMGEVVDVVAIDDECPARSMSRTGANRQRYNGISIASREVGKKKRLSACWSISNA